MYIYIYIYIYMYTHGTCLCIMLTQNDQRSNVQQISRKEVTLASCFDDRAGRLASETTRDCECLSRGCSLNTPVNRISKSHIDQFESQAFPFRVRDFPLE